VDSFYSLSMDKNRHFLTPLPPHLVHVVIEWPLTVLKADPTETQTYKSTSFYYVL
jgi:hypothetical protein